MVDFSQKCIFITLLPMLVQCSLLLLVQSVFSLHCCQNHNLTPKYNVVNVLLVANASPMFFALSAPISFICEWLISVKSVFLSHCCQNHNLTSKFNVVNVLLVANACPMFFAPSSPM